MHIKEYENTIVAILISALMIQGLYTISAISATFDEPYYIAVGLAQIQKGDFDIGKSNPPLIRYIIGAPAYLLGIRIPEEYESGFLEKNPLERRVLFDSHIDYREILFFSRLPILIFSALLGLLVYKWSKEVYGWKAGLLALVLFVFEPNILAHGTIATLDVGMAFFFVLAAYLFWKYSKRNETKYLVLTGVATGMAISSKMAGTHLIPIFFVLLILQIYWKKGRNRLNAVKELRPVLGKVLAILLIAGLVTLMAYEFKVGPVYPKGIERYAPPVGIFDNSTQIGKVTHYLLEKVPLPFNFYLRDVAIQYLHQASPQDNYIFGKIHTGGIWYYYLADYALKFTSPFILILILALLSVSRKRIGRDELYILIPFAFVFLYFSFVVPINTGIRYVIHSVPLLVIFSSRIVPVLEKDRWFNLLIPALLLWHAASSLATAPFYISYFNELAGGPDNGYRYLSQSDLDIGQADLALKDYLEKNQIEKIEYSYAGSVPPEYYGINYGLLPSGFGRGGEVCSPRKGLIAVSATNLNGNLFRNRDCYAWLRNITPDAKVGHVIFIYNITDSRSR